MAGHSRPPPKKKARKERNPERLPNPTSSTEIMDHRIWKEFPADLFEAVIARLPIDTFCRFRSVCRKWNSLPTSHSFAQQCAQVPQSQPWFYTISNVSVNAGSMYDPCLRKWYHTTITASPIKSLLVPVASAGGLICFVNRRHGCLYVCNPLTQSFKELPDISIQDGCRVAVGMTLNAESTARSYKILWVRTDGEYLVYDSLRNSWTQSTMPSRIKLPFSLITRSHAISIDGTLYFLGSDPVGMVSYNTTTGVWKQFSIPAPPDVCNCTLAECAGRILLVGLQARNDARCVCIWELQKMTLLWKEVDRMPILWCLEFYGKLIRMTCFGNKDVIMLSLKSRQKTRLVTYDILSREWLQVRGSKPPGRKSPQVVAWGTAFQPCLTALA
ncbi:F-box only protein 6-like [Diospyros lotus]|uniref:F-box only protein 6-like n=1 Tax=Diospyros lotus TaxID=55363 RepID=UPI002255DA14|nr:F-box only protein 6-like [Diospyros lotus]XP_052205924.1 F-box only protein 6-like [Diospyros lotus]